MLREEINHNICKAKHYIIRGVFMKECTYYDLLGVPMDATDEEIAAAKNFLVKKLHPDANVSDHYDTTAYIQNVLYAYRVLSNPGQRRIYDRRIRNPIRRRDPGDGADERRSGPLSPNFAPYWEAANKLNELVAEGSALLNARSSHNPVMRRLSSRKEPDAAQTEELAQLARQAEIHVKVLESSGIPRKYWYSHAMNWMLFQWSQNREFAYAMLCAMYDTYLEQQKNGTEKRKIQGQASDFLYTLDQIFASRQCSS